MRIGDKVRLIGISPRVKDDGRFKTRTILRKCLGRTFTVKGFQADGARLCNSFRTGCWVELDIGEVIPGCLDSIWVEPEFLRLMPKRHI
jgi:hypothetical protein